MTFFSFFLFSFLYTRTCSAGGRAAYRAQGMSLNADGGSARERSWITLTAASMWSCPVCLGLVCLVEFG